MELQTPNRRQPLSLDEQRDLIRDQLMDAINDDPSGFIDWLGYDKDELLLQIMNGLRYGAGKTPEDKYYEVSRAVEHYVNAYVESRLP